MKQIPLTQGKFALVDDEDFEVLSQFKWQVKKVKNNIYAVRQKYENGKGRNIYMHRAVLEIQKREVCVDHINGNGIDNRRVNLRPCKASQNCANRGASKGSKSKFKGVFWHKQRCKWVSHIGINRKIIYLGLFISEIDAARAYNEAALKYHGEFARLNNI